MIQPSETTCLEKEDTLTKFANNYFFIWIYKILYYKYKNENSFNRYSFSK